MSNWRCVQADSSVNTDAQGRPLLRRSNSLGAGYVQRYTAEAS
jgi:hypothetical protein